MFFRGTLDEFWQALKASAREHAVSGVALSHEQCEAEVQRIVGAVLGPEARVPNDAFKFYSDELCAITKQERERFMTSEPQGGLHRGR